VTYGKEKENRAERIGGAVRRGKMMIGGGGGWGSAKLGSGRMEPSWGGGR